MNMYAHILCLHTYFEYVCTHRQCMHTYCEYVRTHTLFLEQAINLKIKMVHHRVEKFIHIGLC